MRAEIAKVRDDVFLEVAQGTQHLETLETLVSATPWPMNHFHLMLQ